MKALALFALVGAALFACASGPAPLPSDGKRVVKGEKLPAASKGGRTPPPAAPSAKDELPDPPSAEGGTPTLLRAEVDRVVEGGAGRLLAQVRVQPAFRSSRFLGYRVEEILATDSRFRPPHLRPGDVILRVNGFKIGRPEQFIQAFESLRDADEVVFDLWREARRVRLVYPIQGAPASARPATRGASAAAQQVAAP